MSEVTKHQGPPDFSQHAQSVWQRMYPWLWNRGLLRTRSDRLNFELLCVELAIVADSDERLVADGLVVLDQSGGERPHPSIQIRDIYLGYAQQSMRQLGLDPDDQELAALHGAGIGKPS